MKRIVLAAISAALVLGGCSGSVPSKKAVYTAKQRDAIVAKFNPYCNADFDQQLRACDPGTYIIYQLDSGERVYGSLQALDHKTGALQVAWSVKEDGSITSEAFYPGTDLVVPGKIVRIIPPSDYDAVYTALQKFNAQPPYLTMQS